MAYEASPPGNLVSRGRGGKVAPQPVFLNLDPNIPIESHKSHAPTEEFLGPQIHLESFSSTLTNPLVII